MFREKLAIIIPTKDRHDDLRRLLETIYTQDAKPVQVIIVDGGDIPAENLLKKDCELNIDYIKLTPPSLTAQRNAGVKALRKDATLVAFLDDDIILEDGALKNMLKFWETALNNTAGAVFNIRNGLYKKPSLMEKLFLVNAEEPGRILRSGFQGKVAYRNQTTPVKWLSGCAMVYRRAIFKEFMFDEWFTGYALYEDLDFSYIVGKKYKMFIVADAKVKHPVRSEDIKFSSTFGKMQVINKLYVVRKNPDLSVALCCWSLFGLLLNNIIKGIARADRRYINRAKGNIEGLIATLLKI